MTRDGTGEITFNIGTGALARRNIDNHRNAAWQHGDEPTYRQAGVEQ